MEKKNVPFFAKKAENNEVVVKTGVKAGALEARQKMREQDAKAA